MKALGTPPVPPVPTPDGAARGASSGSELEATTYYGRPLLKKPEWHWNVITYLFLGGVMGGSGMLAAFADRGGEDLALARNARYVAFILAAVNPLILIGHLGRPRRFHHMLRVFKLKSVMSMGVWGLIAFSLPAALAATAELAATDFVPARLRFARHLAPPLLIDPLLALLGAFISGYTGVLVSATAVPLWAKGKRHIPFTSVCSGLAGACALNRALLEFTGGNASTKRRLERLESLAGGLELAALLDFRRHAGAELGAPLFAGTRGEKLRLRTLLCGIVVPAVMHLLPGHGRLRTLLASGLTLAGGYNFRESLIEGGKGSADDPKVASRQPE